MSDWISAYHETAPQGNVEHHDTIRRERFLQQLPSELEGLKGLINEIADCMEQYPDHTGCSRIVGFQSLINVFNSHSDKTICLAQRMILAVRFVRINKDDVPAYLVELVESLPSLFQPWISASVDEIEQREQERRKQRDERYALQRKVNAQERKAENDAKAIQRKRRQITSDFMNGKLTAEQYKALMA